MKTTTEVLALSKTRYWYSIWGRTPGWGYDCGWCFGETPELARDNALADAGKWGSRPYKLPADVYLKRDDGSYDTFRVAL